MTRQGFKDELEETELCAINKLVPQLSYIVLLILLQLRRTKNGRLGCLIRWNDKTQKETNITLIT